MKYFNLSSLAVVGCLAVFSAGCEVSDCSPADQDKGVCVQGETLTEFKGAETTDTVDWTTGTPLSVDGLNGEISIKQGTVAGKVVVVTKPFTFRGASKRAEADQDLTVHFKKELFGSGTVGVRTSRDGGGSSIGAHIDVSIPPEFDSTITLRNGNDDIEVFAVANATELDARHDSSATGDCRITGGPNLFKTTVVCAFEATVSGVNDDVNVSTHAAGGDITLSISSIAAASAGGTITSENGDISVSFPSDASYSVQATANAKGVVTEGTLPASCTLQTAAVNSKTVSCGTGPNYIVNAGSKSLLANNVTLGYQ